MKRSPRELEHEVEQLKADRPDADGPDTELDVEWRDADPEARPAGMAYASERDVLTYDVWEAQRECLDALQAGTHDIVAFLAGYGAGKSIFGARWLLEQALAHPGSRFLALGVDFTKARDATFRILFEQLPGDRTGVVTSSYNGPETSPIVADYNRQAHRLTLTNDAVVTLGSADKWNRYAGDEYGGIWMDEPSHYGEDLHDLLEMMGSRLRGVAGPKTMLWTLTGNGYNAAWEILEEQEDKTGDPIGLDIELVRASTLENPYLAPSDRERFERQYGGTGRETQALHGGFAAAQGLVYDRFRRDTHVLPHGEAVARVEDGWRIYGYDAGWNDPRVVLELGRTPDEQLVVLDEFHASESHVEDAIRWLQRNDKPRGTMYCEHEPSDIEKLEQAGYPAEQAEKSLDAGIAEVNRRLRDDGNGPIETAATSVERRRGGERGRRRFRKHGVGHESDADGDGAGESRGGDGGGDVDGRIGLLVSARCEHTIREFLSYREEHVGTSQAVDHCVDSVRYACMGATSGSKVQRLTWGT